LIKLVKNYPKIAAIMVLILVLVISIILKQLVSLFYKNQQPLALVQESSAVDTEQVTSISENVDIIQEQEEMRAIWVPFMSITMSSEIDKKVKLLFKKNLMRLSGSRKKKA